MITDLGENLGDAAGQDFDARWMVTYFVLYVSLVLLAYLSGG